MIKEPLDDFLCWYFGHDHDTIWPTFRGPEPGCARCFKGRFELMLEEFSGPTRNDPLEEPRFWGRFSLRWWPFGHPKGEGTICVRD